MIPPVVGKREHRYARRLGFAFAASIVLHEIVAGLWPRTESAPPEERVATEAVTIAKRVRPPAPTPAPTPTPRTTPAPHYTIAPQIVVRAPAARAAATPARTLGGAAAAKNAERRIRVPIHSAPAASLAEGAHAGRQNGGSGSGAGPGAGSGGLGGTGTGTGASGNGTGGDSDSAPCADIYLLPGRLSFRKDGAAVQEVLAKLVLRDGSVEIGKFPYPFVYSAEAQNPFRHDVGLAQNGGIAVQLPPAGTDVSTLPESVQVVLEHTNASTGVTDLPECAPQPATT
ncbi:MAG: hypothetical protein IAI50_12995, partial [Candidatus Eremiobacteraeota bacterium]|nr:hypothetical protein [Candidatus Eremiobacteraeota bacterium]